MLRTYEHGQLVREEAVPEGRMPVDGVDPVAGPPAVKTRRKREVRMGKTIFKGAPSYDLMLQLQLGIRWSVGRITPEPPRELRDTDFSRGDKATAVSARFPRGGSSSTPPHAAHDFKWKDYCPMARWLLLSAARLSRARRCSASCASASASMPETTCCRSAVRA
jgi:1-phosphatidylinositol-4-phosphate 5-kinase